MLVSKAELGEAPGAPPDALLRGFLVTTGGQPPFCEAASSDTGCEGGSADGMFLLRKTREEQTPVPCHSKGRDDGSSLAVGIHPFWLKLPIGKSLQRCRLPQLLASLQNLVCCSKIKPESTKLRSSVTSLCSVTTPSTEGSLSVSRASCGDTNKKKKSPSPKEQS